jgi:hypothetical protein
MPIKKALPQHPFCDPSWSMGRLDSQRKRRVRRDGWTLERELGFLGSCDGWSSGKEPMSRRDRL